MKQLRLAALLALARAPGASTVQDPPDEGVTVRPVIQPPRADAPERRSVSRARGLELPRRRAAEGAGAHHAYRGGAGEADFTAASWGTLRGPFFQEAGGKAVLSKVGALIEGALQGCLVDRASYDTGVQDLGDLEDSEAAARFGASGKADLAGCVPGRGCERLIEHHLDEYGLRDTATHNRVECNAIIADTMAASRYSPALGSRTECRARCLRARTWSGWRSPVPRSLTA